MKQVAELWPLVWRADHDLRKVLPSQHAPGNRTPLTRKLTKRLSRVRDLAAADVVGWQVATDSPPTHRTWCPLGLHCPDCEIWMHMEGGILADAAVVDSLALQVLLHDFPLRSNPLVLFGLRLRHGKNAYGPNVKAVYPPCPDAEALRRFVRGRRA